MILTSRTIQTVSKPHFWLIVFVFAFIGQLALPGVVLCLEYDGSMAIEPSPNGILCGDDYNSKLVDPDFFHLSGEEYEEGHCGECVDLQASYWYLNANKSSSHDADLGIKVPSYTSLLTFLPDLAGIHMQGLLQQPTLFANPTSISLQKTILLC